MTEAEWLECADPQKMLTFLEGKARDRKLRLFAVACCRRVQDFLWTEHSNLAVLLAERHADGWANIDDLDTARLQVENSLELYESEPVYDASYWACSRNIEDNVAKCAWYAVNCSTRQVDGDASDLDARCQEVMQEERAKQALLLYDIFGNPFRPVTISSTWQTPTVVSLAQAIYDERAFDRMPILADALEDAGCTNQDILDHCRQPGQHVRGCWVVDLLLAKE